MSNTFKIGDHVRVNDTYTQRYMRGQEAIVVDIIQDNLLLVEFEHNFSDGYTNSRRWIFCTDRLELLSAFKVGDRVRVKTNYAANAGAYGTITDKTAEEGYVWVRFDNLFRNLHDWLVQIEALEPVQVETGCTCDIMKLMQSGCTCGAIEKERNEQRN